MYKNRKLQGSNQSPASDFASSDSLDESAKGRCGIKLGNCIDFITPSVFGCYIYILRPRGSMEPCLLPKRLLSRMSERLGIGTRDSKFK